jgi:hypothetical protein
LSQNVLNVPYSPAVGGVTLSYISNARLDTDILQAARSWIITYYSLAMSTNVTCSGGLTLVAPSLQGWLIHFYRRDRGNCVADLPRRETTDSDEMRRRSTATLANYVCHHRKQRVIRSGCSHGTRSLPQWLSRAARRDGRHHTTRCT